MERNRMPWQSGPKEAIKTGLYHGMCLGLAINLVIETGYNFNQLSEFGKISCVEPSMQIVTCSIDWLEQKRKRIVLDYFSNGKR